MFIPSQWAYDDEIKIDKTDTLQKIMKEHELSGFGRFKSPVHDLTILITYYSVRW